MIRTVCFEYEIRGMLLTYLSVLDHYSGSVRCSDNGLQDGPVPVVRRPGKLPGGHPLFGSPLPCESVRVPVRSPCSRSRGQSNSIDSFISEHSNAPSPRSMRGVAMQSNEVGVDEPVSSSACDLQKTQIIPGPDACDSMSVERFVKAASFVEEDVPVPVCSAPSAGG
ncbi:hypothetical protein T10_11676, partial [Trichinella papuae]